MKHSLFDGVTNFVCPVFDFSEVDVRFLPLFYEGVLRYDKKASDGIFNVDWASGTDAACPRDPSSAHLLAAEIGHFESKSTDDPVGHTLGFFTHRFYPEVELDLVSAGRSRKV